LKSKAYGASISAAGAVAGSLAANATDPYKKKLRCYRWSRQYIKRYRALWSGLCDNLLYDGEESHAQGSLHVSKMQRCAASLRMSSGQKTMHG